MDIKDFVDIGIADIFWRYNEFSLEWRKAFISLYVPKIIGYNYGNQYCLKISFLDGDLVCEEELFESMKFDLKIIDDKKILIEMLGEQFIVSEKQLCKIKKTIVL